MRHPYFNKAVANVFTRNWSPRASPPQLLHLLHGRSVADWCKYSPHQDRGKFRIRRSIFRLLILVVKQALAKAINMPSLEFWYRSRSKDIPVYKPGEEGEATNFHPDAFLNPSYNPFIDPSGMVTHLGATGTVYDTSLLPTTTRLGQAFWKFRKECSTWEVTRLIGL